MLQGYDVISAFISAKRLYYKGEHGPASDCLKKIFPMLQLKFAVAYLLLLNVLRSAAQFELGARIEKSQHPKLKTGSSVSL